MWLVIKQYFMWRNLYQLNIIKIYFSSKKRFCKKFTNFLINTIRAQIYKVYTNKIWLVNSVYTKYIHIQSNKIIIIDDYIDALSLGISE